VEDKGRAKEEKQRVGKEERLLGRKWIKYEKQNETKI
jgi:hypothetical protein